MKKNIKQYRENNTETTMKYNAFISYNHNPRDIKIAKELQARLERYRIPKSISADFGTNRISRVFLDVGELGVSSDLNDTIKQALDNTEYLIVICSPDSKQSPWVHKEIDYFLSKHSVENVLAVISEGEPREVFPDEIVKDREPLACDFRSKSPQSNKRELLRLVATIIGCKYDDLIQRQKQYRMKQIAIVSVFAFLIMSSAITYLIWSNQRIKENYNNTLVEQSKNLSLQSEEALHNGDKIGAIELALDALPKTGHERPVVSEAVYALAEATDVYKTPKEHRRWVGVNRFDSFERMITDFEVSTLSEKSILVEVFSNGRVAMYDTDSGKELFHDYTEKLFEEGFVSSKVKFIGDDNLLIVCTNAIVLFDINKGEEVYRETKAEHITLNASLSRKLAISKDTLWVSMHDNNSIGTNSEEAIIAINLKNGETIDAISIGNDTPYNLSISKDGKYLAYYVEDNSTERDTLYVIDLKNKSRVATIEKTGITDIGFNYNNKLLVCGANNLPEEDEKALYNHSTVNSITTTLEANMTVYVTCINPNDGTDIWERKVKKRINGRPTLEIDFDGVTNEKSILHDRVICVDNKTLMIFNAMGKLEKDVNFGSTIRCLYYYPENIDDIRVILRNGNIALYNIRKDKIETLYDVFNDPVESAKVENGYIYTLRNRTGFNDNYVTKYSYKGYDPEYKDYSEILVDKGSGLYNKTDSCGEMFVEVIGEYGSYSRIVTRHSKTGDILLDQELVIRDDIPNSKGEKFEYKYAGVNQASEEAVFIGHSYSGGYNIKTVDLTTGEEKEIFFPSLEESSNNIDRVEKLPTDYYQKGDYLIDENLVYTAVIKNEQSEDEDGLITDNSVISIVRLDLNNEKREEYNISSIPKELVDRVKKSKDIVIDSYAKALVFYDESKLYCYKFDGEKIWETKKLTYELNAFTCFDKRLIVTGTSALKSEVYVYDMKRGIQEGYLDLGYSVHYSDRISAIKLDDNDIALIDYNAYIVDNNTYGLKGIIPHYRAFNADTRELEVGSDSYGFQGNVPYRNLNELIELGNELIKTDTRG